MWPFNRKRKLELSVNPVLSVLEELEPHRRYTPDLARLEMLQHHFLFVPGEMQQRHHQQEMLSLEERTGWEAFTQLNFHFLMHDLGVMSHPLLFHDLKPIKPLAALPIKGEIVRISSRRFLDLDNYYHNTVRFVRLPVMLVVPFTKLLFNDRRMANNLFPIKQPVFEDSPYLVGLAKDKHENRKKTLSPRQTADVNKNGVYRVWAFTYFAPSNYWYELLSDYNNPPVKSFDNPDGLIKKYYRFTIDQYDPPF